MDSGPIQLPAELRAAFAPVLDFLRVHPWFAGEARRFLRDFHKSLEADVEQAHRIPQRPLTGMELPGPSSGVVEPEVQIPGPKTRITPPTVTRKTTTPIDTTTPVTRTAPPSTPGRPQFAALPPGVGLVSFTQAEIEEALLAPIPDDVIEGYRDVRFSLSEESTEAAYSGGDMRKRVSGCANCGGLDHKFRECPAPQRAVFCYKCHTPGVTQKTCPRCGIEWRDSFTAWSGREPRE